MKNCRSGRVRMDNGMKVFIGAGYYVVDAGCGAVHMPNELAGQFEPRIGLDVSRERLDKLGNDRTDEWQFRVGDLNEALPLDDGSAYTVIADQVIEHIF